MQSSSERIAELEAKLDACQSSRVWLQEQLDIEQKRSAELEARLYAQSKPRQG